MTEKDRLESRRFDEERVNNEFRFMQYRKKLIKSDYEPTNENSLAIALVGLLVSLFFALGIGALVYLGIQSGYLTGGNYGNKNFQNQKREDVQSKSQVCWPAMHVNQFK